jgi:hypothetical protein
MSRNGFLRSASTDRSWPPLHFRHRNRNFVITNRTFLDLFKLPAVAFPSGI